MYLEILDKSKISKNKKFLEEVVGLEVKEIDHNGKRFLDVSGDEEEALFSFLKSVRPVY